MLLEEIIKKVEEQPRLQEFVMQLYTRSNEGYQLYELKNMDNENLKIAFRIVRDIYPSSVFENTEFYKRYFDND
jgi:hypothetical protein